MRMEEFTVAVTTIQKVVSDIAVCYTMQGAGVGAGGLSSLPLQVVIYFSGWYLVLFYPALLAALIYKGDQNALFGTVTLLFILRL